MNTVPSRHTGVVGLRVKLIDGIGKTSMVTERNVSHPLAVAVTVYVVVVVGVAVTVLPVADESELLGLHSNVADAEEADNTVFCPGHRIVSTAVRPMIGLEILTFTG